MIATVHRPDDVVRAVESVLACSYPSFEVLVVDQSSDGRAAADLAPYEADGRLRRLVVAEPRLSRALNTGAANSEADLVAITGDDCVVPVGWLAAVENAFAENDAVAIVFGSVHAGPCDPAEGFVPGCLHRARGSCDESRGHPRAQRHDRLHGATREEWLALGGFDESLGLGGPLRSGKDLDLALRALRAGRHVLQTPAVEVEHLTPVLWGERKVVRRNWYGSGAAFSKGLKLAPGPRCGPFAGSPDAGAAAARASPRLTARGRPAARCSSASPRVSSSGCCGRSAGAPACFAAFASPAEAWASSARVASRSNPSRVLLSALFQYCVPDSLGDLAEVVARAREPSVELALGRDLAQIVDGDEG